MKDKFCLQSVVPFKGINNSPANKSKSKQTFSFQKSPRFQTLPSICPYNSYGGEYIKRRNAGAGIGYGKKFDFTKNLPLSPSCKYTIPTIFDENHNKSKGFSLRFSREVHPQLSKNLLCNSYIDPSLFKNPGVGQYRMKTEGIKTILSPSYSIRKKVKIADVKYSIEAQNDNPGPSQYENNPQKLPNYIGSSYKKLSFSNSKSRRFSNSDNHIPGPGQYQQSCNLASAGYIVSQQKRAILSKFGGSRRITQFQQAAKNSQLNPGPGSYRLTSQFGQYDGDVYNYNIYKNSPRAK